MSIPNGILLKLCGISNMYNEVVNILCIVIFITVNRITGSIPIFLITLSKSERGVKRSHIRQLCKKDSLFNVQATKHILMLAKQ